MIDLSPLRLVILPGRNSTSETKEMYDSAYETWKLVWKQTLLELDGSDTLFSDHFTRQDYFFAVFHRQLCVASVSFRRIDPSSIVHSDDSWFKPWPREAVNEFGKTYSNALMASWLTIHPNYRKSDGDPYLSSLELSRRAIEMMSFFMLDAQADITFAAARNNRSVNKLCLYGGCQVYKPNVIHHGVEVDLITWVPRDLIRAVETFPKVSHELWNSRRVYSDELLQLSNPRDLRKKNRSA